MKAKAASWRRSYKLALRKYLEHRRGSGVRAALALGRRAVDLGLEPLDVAKTQLQALKALARPGGLAVRLPDRASRAKKFFAEAIVPIERTHRVAQFADQRIAQVTRTLNRRVIEVADSARRLKYGIVRREAAELALKKRKALQARLLRESLRLQGRLRLLTHASMKTQEMGRRRSSHRLQDQIAQRLLGVLVRLESLKKSLKVGAGSLKKEIGATQRIVTGSARRIEKLAYAFSSEDQA